MIVLGLAAWFSARGFASEPASFPPEIVGPGSPLLKLNLDDPRLDLETLKREAAQHQELMKKFEGQGLVLALRPFGLGTLDDATLDPWIRAIFQDRLKQHEAEFEKYEQQWVDERAADPLFDFKVRAALLVANDHVNRRTGPRGGGILPAFKCTDPREFERARDRQVGLFQTAILKQKFNLDWSPPPPPPAVTVWDREELERLVGRPRLAADNHNAPPGK